MALKQESSNFEEQSRSPRLGYVVAASSRSMDHRVCFARGWPYTVSSEGRVSKLRMVRDELISLHLEPEFELD